ncbi:MAG: hypothetical protein Q9176_006561 [Flavoplaca citrina]
MAIQKIDEFKKRLAQPCDLNSPADVAVMQRTVRDFMRSLHSDHFAKALVKDEPLLDQFCRFVSRDEVFVVVKMVVWQFRTSMYENLEILERSQGANVSTGTKCLIIILERLDQDSRLPPRFRYGTGFSTEAAMMVDRQLRWMRQLLSGGQGIEPGSSEEADVKELHRLVEKVLRPVALARADASTTPALDPYPVLRDQSGGDEDEDMEL